MKFQKLTKNSATLFKNGGLLTMEPSGKKVEQKQLSDDKQEGQRIQSDRISLSYHSPRMAFAQFVS